MSYKITYNPQEDRMLVKFEALGVSSLAVTRRQMATIVYQLHRIDDAPEELYRTARPADTSNGRKNEIAGTDDMSELTGDAKPQTEKAGNDHEIQAGSPILVRSVAVLKKASGACVSLNYRHPQAESMLAIRIDLDESDIAAFGQQLVNLCRQAGWDLEAAHERLDNQKVNAQKPRQTQLN